MMDENRRGDIAKDAIKIFAGSSNPALARDICAYLGVPVDGPYKMDHYRY